MRVVLVLESLTSLSTITLWTTALFLAYDPTAAYSPPLISFTAATLLSREILHFTRRVLHARTSPPPPLSLHIERLSTPTPPHSDDSPHSTTPPTTTTPPPLHPSDYSRLNAPRTPSDPDRRLPPFYTPPRRPHGRQDY